MENTSDEIEGSHFGEAIPPYDLDDLSKNISDIDTVVVNFCKKPTKRKKTRERLLGSLVCMLDDAIEQLGLYKEDLIENKCIESFEVSSEPNEKDAEDFWKFVGIFFDKIKNDEVYQSLKDKVAQFRALLAEVENAMRNCDPIVFEKYYQNSKRGFNKAEVVNDFNRELYKNLPITEKKLCVMQAKAVIKAIKSGIFSLNDEVSKDEVLAVRPELETNLVPSNFKITEEFEEAYAIFRRCADKKGIMLVLNYKRYGKYLVDHKKKLNDDYFKAIFELDTMLHLINQEMENRYPELVSTPVEQPAVNQPEVKEELFHFIHPEIEDEEAWKIHRAIKRVVAYQGLPEICQYLKQLADNKKIMLPQIAERMYSELVRLGMYDGDGYSLRNFRNFYKR